CASLGNYFDYW
nr:immunoglobulin heavy chain junction region [Mus musculus]